MIAQSVARIMMAEPAVMEILVQSHSDGLTIKGGGRSWHLSTSGSRPGPKLDVPQYWHSSNTGDEGSMNAAKGWISNCIANHRTVCSSNAPNTAQLPARVLDLESDRECGVHLQVTHGECASYACLSHSWGGHQPLRTLKATLSEHRQGISWDMFPRTFQDAITVTRSLGIRYLWIDSICIIQDDKEDWREQAALMGHIYHNATVTIAGSESKGPYDGLFANFHGGSEMDKGGLYLRTAVSFHSRAILPLLSRGWVFQERLLSPRFLHFTQRELIYECQEGCECQCSDIDGGGIGPGMVRLIHSSPHLLANWKESKRAALGLHMKPPQEAAAIWRGLVSHYVGLKLTIESDVLPALSALAKCMPPTAGKYIAGLWENSFIDDLLWICTWGQHNCYAVKEWRAPSFSWASQRFVKFNTSFHHSEEETQAIWDGAASWRDTDDGITTTTTHVRLVSSHCAVKGSDPTGELESAHVVLSGPLFASTDSSHHEGFPIRDDLTTKGSPQKHIVRIRRDGVRPNPTGGKEDIWYLLMKSCRSSQLLPLTRLDGQRKQALVMLMLRKVGLEDGCDGVFERVGLVACNSMDMEPPVDDWLDRRQSKDDAIVKLI
jgi:hypothetical protein